MRRKLIDYKKAGSTKGQRLFKNRYIIKACTKPMTYSQSVS